MTRADSLKKTQFWERLKAEENRAKEDEMVGWHHQCNGLGFGQTPGDGEGQRNLECCSPWGHEVRHDLVTEHIHRFSWLGSIAVI